MQEGQTAVVLNYQRLLNSRGRGSLPLEWYLQGHAGAAVV